MLDSNKTISLIVKVLEDMQAADIRIIDVRGQTAITDYMIIASGRASRHVKATAEKTINEMKLIGLMPLHTTGLEQGEWALIDLGDYILHIMQPDTRQFYNLEGLWE